MKDDVKHTPGPWRVAPNRSLSGAIETDFSPFNHTLLGCTFGESPVHQANARLMAAAPDLLAALEGVLRVADRKTDEFDAARSAIAKATKGTP